MNLVNDQLHAACQLELYQEAKKTRDFLMEKIMWEILSKTLPSAVYYAQEERKNLLQRLGK